MLAKEGRGRCIEVPGNYSDVPKKIYLSARDRACVFSDDLRDRKSVATGLLLRFSRHIDCNFIELCCSDIDWFAGPSLRALSNIDVFINFSGALVSCRRLGFEVNRVNVYYL